LQATLVFNVKILLKSLASLTFATPLKVKGAYAQNGQAAGARNSLLPFSFLYRCKSTTIF